MGAKVDLVIWFQPVMGEPFTVSSTEFDVVDQALDGLRRALQEGESMLFAASRPDGPDSQIRTAPTLVNFRHILAVRVWERDADSDEAGQYL
jgi:hypothetical protein